MTDPPLRVAIETDAAAWDAFVTAHPSATAYHAWAWRQVFGGVFGHVPFKKQWKAVAHPLHWEYALLTRDDLPDQGPTNTKFHLAVETWKRLPLAVANRLGPLIIGGIP